MSKEEIVYKVKLAEHSERYQDMIVYIKALIEETKGDLNNEERTLFWAFKPYNWIQKKTGKGASILLSWICESYW